MWCFVGKGWVGGENKEQEGRKWEREAERKKAVKT